MANSILIMGESGTGKSYSIGGLDPAETYIINVLNKPLPIKGAAKKYVTGSNYIATDNAKKIIEIIQSIGKNRPDIKNIVLDDFQYVMANEYMRNALDKGFDKFNRIGNSGWSVIHNCTLARDDLYVFVLSHTQTDENSGIVRCKTIGKMINEKICLEGMFTIVLHSLKVDNRYKFLTQNDGTRIAKSPPDMFESELIDNDISFVKQKIAEYLGECEPLPKRSSKERYLDAIQNAKNSEELKEKFQAAQDYSKQLDDKEMFNSFLEVAKAKSEQLKKDFSTKHGDG